MNKNIKKTVALATGALVLSMGAVGCADVEKEVKVAVDAQQSISNAQIADLNTQLEVLQTTVAIGNEEALELEVAKLKLQTEIEAVTQAKLAAEAEVIRIQAEYALEKKTVEKEVVAKACAEKIEKTLDASLATTIDNKDLDKLFEGKIKFDGDSYDVEEELVISDDLKVGLSSTHDEEFEANPYLVLEASGAVAYKYVFKDTINMSLIDEDEPLKIKFLGKEISITSIDANGLTIREGAKKLVSPGDEFEVNGKTVKIVVISNDKIGVEVDGEFGTVEIDESDRINGVDILVEEVISSAKATATDYATIIVGEDSEKDIDVGDEYVEDEDAWVWTINATGDNLESIGVESNVVIDELDDDYQPIAVGESIVLPENYLEIKFDSLKNTDYLRVEADFYEFGTNDVNTVRFESDDEIFYADGEWLDKVSYNGTHTFYKEDGDEYTQLEPTFKIVNDDMEYTVSFSGTSVNIGDLSFVPSVDTGYGDEFTYLGITDKDAESTEVTYNGTNIGNNEFDYLAADGMIVKVTESNGDKDKLVFEIPSDAVEAVICIN